MEKTGPQLIFSTAQEWSTSKRRLLVLSGVTASGKSALALELYQQSAVCLINADSLLFFRELNIGTAKPDAAALAQTPHHLVNICSIADSFNASRYCEQAWPLMEQAWQQGKTVVLVGGSGFYLQALLFGMNNSQTPNAAILRHSQLLYDREGIAPFIALLQLVDPAILAKVHPSDHYRLRRACEHWWSNHTTFSGAQEQQRTIKHQTPLWKERGLAVKVIFLDRPKAQQYEWIEQRTAAMIREGLIEEVSNLLTQFDPGLKPLQSIGYRETIEWLKLPPSERSLAQLQEQINIHTRQLAKAQRTWFAHWEKAVLHPEEERARQWPILQELF